MKIEISSASNDAIEERYKESAHKIASYLSEENCELIWGSGNKSIMGICYEEFEKRNCKIWGYTTEKYKDELSELPKATHKICKDTFELKKAMFEDADILLFLPGGTGTVSELFSYIEELRSNDTNKVLIVYNEYNHFDKCFLLIDDLINRNFNSKSIYNYFYIVNNFEEFKTLFTKLKTSNN